MEDYANWKLPPASSNSSSFRGPEGGREGGKKEGEEELDRQTEATVGGRRYVTEFKTAFSGIASRGRKKTLHLREIICLPFFSVFCIAVGVHCVRLGFLTAKDVNCDRTKTHHRSLPHSSSTH